MTAIMIEQCIQQLERQQDSIINRLKSSQEKLLKNIKLNPKLWNTECLSIVIDTKETDSSNFGLSSSINLNNPQIKKLDGKPNDEARNENARMIMVEPPSPNKSFLVQYSLKKQ